MKVFQQYSCVNEDIMSISGIWAYEKWECIKKTLSSLAFDALTFTIEMTLLAGLSFKAINIKVMSENLRRMQKKFLIQLIVQTLVPMICVIIPVVWELVLVVFNVFGATESSSQLVV